MILERYPMYILMLLKVINSWESRQGSHLHYGNAMSGRWSRAERAMEHRRVGHGAGKSGPWSREERVIEHGRVVYGEGRAGHGAGQSGPWSRAERAMEQGWAGHGAGHWRAWSREERAMEQGRAGHGAGKSGPWSRAERDMKQEMIVLPNTCQSGTLWLHAPLCALLTVPLIHQYTKVTSGPAQKKFMT